MSTTAYRLQNHENIWNSLWRAEQTMQWRTVALDKLYSRIVQLAGQGEGRPALDIGGGNGALADKLKAAGWDVYVLDHSSEALRQAANKGHHTILCNLEDEPLPTGSEPWGLVVSTELLEHLSDEAMHKVLQWSKDQGCKCFHTMPNNTLGPDEEPQHARKVTCLQFLQLLRTYFPGTGAARVEVVDKPRVTPNASDDMVYAGAKYGSVYLLGVCGFSKGFTLALTLPVRDEEADLERVLKSFRGYVDEIVIGMDPRSKDRSREIAEAYAETIFDLVDPQGTSVDGMEAGTDEEEQKLVHFAHLRNQCLDHCATDWTFMTEGHESLATGGDVLLKLDTLMPSAALLGFVFRTSLEERWGFPWLMRMNPGFKYTRRCHNMPDFPEGTLITYLPQVTTLHQRDINNAIARAKQRKVVNRKTLLEDWIVNKSEMSLYYLGSEWRGVDKDDHRAIERLEQLLALPRHNGPMAYQARMILATLYAKHGRKADARNVLMGCAGEDWSRTEHWIWLGDIAFEAERHEEALRFYLYAATTINEPPVTVWWIRLNNYTYLPAQRLAMCYAALGRAKDSQYWAERVMELLPEGAPENMIEECRKNLEDLNTAIGGVDTTQLAKEQAS